MAQLYDPDFTLLKQGKAAMYEKNIIIIIIIIMLNWPRHVERMSKDRMTKMICMLEAKGARWKEEEMDGRIKGGFRMLLVLKIDEGEMCIEW